MPIYRTARYNVKPESVEKVRELLQEYVAMVRQNEPGTLIYVVIQEKTEPTGFMHFGIYEDAAAQDRHNNNEYVKRYADALWGETIAPATFTDYVIVGTNQRQSTGV